MGIENAWSDFQVFTGIKKQENIETTGRRKMITAKEVGQKMEQEAKKMVDKAKEVAEDYTAKVKRSIVDFGEASRDYVDKNKHLEKENQLLKDQIEQMVQKEELDKLKEQNKKLQADADQALQNQIQSLKSEKE